MGYKLEPKKYPLPTQLRVFESHDDIRQYLSDSTQRLVYCEDYCYFIGDSEYIYSDEISDILSRYGMQEQGYISFSNLYDDLPAKWIDAVRIIKSTMADAMKEHSRRQEQKHG